MNVCIDVSAYAVVKGTQHFLLLVGGKRLTDAADWGTWSGPVPTPGDTVTIEGIVTAGYRNNPRGGLPYRELELISVTTAR